MEARARVVITGQVQGVFFRREIMVLARRLGITGWVRNLPDGRVEAVIEAEKPKLDELIKFCYAGPPAARVKNVQVEWSDSRREFRGFRITR